MTKDRKKGWQMPSPEQLATHEGEQRAELDFDELEVMRVVDVAKTFVAHRRWRGRRDDDKTRLATRLLDNPELVAALEAQAAWDNARYYLRRAGFDTEPLKLVGKPLRERVNELIAETEEAQDERETAIDRAVEKGMAQKKQLSARVDDDGGETGKA